MAHIDSIGAGMFSAMAISREATEKTLSQLRPMTTLNAFKDLFANQIQPDGTPATGTFILVPNVREYPGLGTPPNVVNVPNYGSSTSLQIQAQADPDSMELTLNYVPKDWAADTVLGQMVGDGKTRAVMFSLLNSEPAGYDCSVGGLGTVDNSLFFFLAKLDALQVSPDLADANQATLTMTLQSKFYGAFTQPGQ